MILRKSVHYPIREPNKPQLPDPGGDIAWSQLRNSKLLKELYLQNKKHDRQPKPSYIADIASNYFLSFLVEREVNIPKD
jgi:hypothetical protein